MLVNHLTHRVLEQHDKLVERLDLALKLDAVDQENGHRDVFLAQRIQVRVL